LTHLLKGRIELDSTPGAGTRFSIVLPVTFSQQTTPLMPESASGDSESSPAQ
jgi:hypothetical protein